MSVLQKIKLFLSFFGQSSHELENNFCFEDGDRKKKVQFYQGNAFMLRVSNLTFGVLVRLQNFTPLNLKGLFCSVFNLMPNFVWL